jgi:hypothetical protein
MEIKKHKKKKNGNKKDLIRIAGKAVGINVGNGR